MIRALVYATLLVSFLASAGAIAGAQERVETPVALDFSPLGSSVASDAHAAPADVSFGQYPLSVLGIENAIRHADARVLAYANGAERIDVGPIAYSVVAIRDWEHRYPSDPWIAKDLLALYRFYAHVGTGEARATAERAAAWLRHDYPDSAYAHALTLAETHP